MSTYNSIVKELEQELYDAIQALEEGDLITVRQCSGRAQHRATAAWQAQRTEAGEKDATKKTP